jgi:hypothetical protein
MPDRVTFHFWTGWRLFKSNASVFVVSILLLFLSWLVLEVAIVFLHRLGFAVWLMLHLAWLFLFAGLLVGMHVMALKSVDGEIPRVGDLFGSLKRALLGIGLDIPFPVSLLAIAGFYRSLHSAAV